MRGTGAFGVSFRSIVIARFLRDESGQAMAEYSLVAACCAVVMIAVIFVMRTWSGSNLTGTQTKLSNEANSP